MNSASAQIQIVKVDAGQWSRASDAIIEEEELKILINDVPAYGLAYSLENPLELVTGLLFTQGVIESCADILTCELDNTARVCRVRLKDPGRPGTGEPLTRGSSGGYLIPGCVAGHAGQVRPEPAAPLLAEGRVKALMDLHFSHSKLFQKTGAVHSAGLTDGRQMLAFFEDIGRHNALDKLIGHMLMEEIPPNDKIVTLSCRLSMEIIGKLIRAGVPMVMSNAAPTLTAVTLARENGLTMVGFARGDRFNVYSHPDRISAAPDSPSK